MGNVTAGKLYKVRVYESFGDYIHNDAMTINEIFVPSLGIGINNVGGINIFDSSEDRYKKNGEFVKDIVIDSETGSVIKELYEAMNKSKSLKEKISGKLNNMLERR
jgi:hypothetical protein